MEISPLEPITDIIQNICDLYGKKAIGLLSKILSTKETTVPSDFDEPEDMISWLETDYIPLEVSLLSPGAMSNAPDRFDGFHSFNKCCRGKADTGRHKTNLKSYSTDRRVFEFWSEGDWIAADRLMGLVKSVLIKEACADGGGGPPTADHIGPLSLGFCHRPEFRLLSKIANSAKNNRMTLSDVQHLRTCEKKGINVVSWYAKPLWDLRKESVDSGEKALRISKLLRDNQRNAMRILCEMFAEKKYSFLIFLLELGYADRNVGFLKLRAENYITCYDRIITRPRKTKYSAEQKARRIRIGFEALRTYKEKSNRHSFLVAEEFVKDHVNEAVKVLDSGDRKITEFDVMVDSVLYPGNGAVSEQGLRHIAKTFPIDKKNFEHTKNILATAMEKVGQEISAMWENDRYVRNDS